MLSGRASADPPTSPPTDRPTIPPPDHVTGRGRPPQTPRSRPILPAPARGRLVTGYGRAPSAVLRTAPLRSAPARNLARLAVPAARAAARRASGSWGTGSKPGQAPTSAGRSPGIRAELTVPELRPCVHVSPMV